MAVDEPSPPPRDPSAAVPNGGGRFQPNWLAQRQRLTPDRLAVACGEERWSFAELERRVLAAAYRLRQEGIRPRDRVGVLLRNGMGYVELVHALMRIGAILVPLNSRLTPAELEWQLNDAAVASLVHDDHHAPLAERGGHRLPSRLRWETPQARPIPASTPARETFSEQVDLEAIQAMIYTSGTTGRPKGAMLTYGNHWWNAMGSMLNLGLRDDDRWLACMPLFHVGGLSILLRSVIYGIPAVIHPSFDPAAVNQAIDEEEISIVSLVPTMLQRVLETRARKPFPPTLRCVLLGGGSASGPLLQACAELGVPIVQTYGLTETASQVATLAPGDALRKLGSSGKPLFPMELRIEEKGSTAPHGAIGEIVVRGPTVMAGYFRHPEATKRAIRDGWLHTGDLGYLDDEGYLYVVDRRDDLIVSGGENVYPAEVEAVLATHPAVAEAGVIGVPDETWGQTVVAAITLKPGTFAGEEELIAFCRARLARYKTPTRLHIVDALPRTAAGKLMRSRIRLLYEPTSSLKPST